MDANNTRFHLLLGETDWKRCSAVAGLAAGLSADDAPAALAVDGERTLPECEDTIAGSPDGDIKKIPFEWDSARNELTLHRRATRFMTGATDRAPTFSDRRGAGCDQYGNWYWIDQPKRSVLVRSSGSDTVSTYWPLASGGETAKGGTPKQDTPKHGTFKRGDFAPSFAQTSASAMRLAGLAVTEDHYLVVGTLQPKGLLIFDLHTVGIPRQILWPDSIDFTPFDMASMPGGGVWILDRANKRYWGLDHNFALVGDGQTRQSLRSQSSDDFQPKTGDGTRISPARTFSNGIALLDMLNPVAIEALPDGSVLILDTPIKKQHPDERFSRVYRYRFEQRLGEPVLVDSICKLFPEEEATCHLLAHDFAFLPDKGNASSSGDVLGGHVVLVAESGNQSYVFDLLCQDTVSELVSDTVKLKASPDYLPMRLFGGRALVVGRSRVHDADLDDDGPAARAYYDFVSGNEVRWLPLAVQLRARYETETTIFTQRFDGRDFDCVWHRLIVDGCIPPGCSVEIYSRTANEWDAFASPDLTPDLTPDLAWQPEPRLYLRSDGAELPYVRRSSARANASTQDGSWELLLQQARGRYLQLKLVLRGDGRLTPRLRAMRVYYPRFAYTSYLPGLYRDRAPLLELYAAPDSESIDSLLMQIVTVLQGLSDEERAAIESTYAVQREPNLDWLAGPNQSIFASLFRRLDVFEADRVRDAAVSLSEYLASLSPSDLARERGRFAKENEFLLVLIDEQQRYAQASFTFLDRFLANFEGIFTAIEDRIAAVQLLFDVRSAPSDTLDWLARWFDLSLEAGWTERQRRLMIKHAMTFFQFRGTAFGLRMALRLALDECPDDSIFRLYPASTGELRQADAIRIIERFTTQPSLPAANTLLLRSDGPSLAGGATLPIGASVAKSAFMRRHLEITEGDRPLWARFLEQRYQEIGALINAHGLQASAQRKAPVSFDEVELPAQLPVHSKAREDWIHFEKYVLPHGRNAHRFTVQLPVRYSGQRNTSGFQQKLERAEQIVTLQKPAHTTFDIKFYWAMFRVDEARLGLDTMIGLGSRAPELLPPMMLGANYLVEGTLSPGYPQNLWQRSGQSATAAPSAFGIASARSSSETPFRSDFIVVGRDRLTS